jgi:hypothetical protein
MILLLSLLLALPMARPQAAPQQAPVQPGAEAQAVAAIMQFSGEVLVRHGQVWLRVDKVPRNLVTGDTVTTDRGRAEVHFLSDDSTLVLDIGTHLTVSETQMHMGWLRHVQILLGDVWFHMQHSLNRKTELATPTAVGGLRGTQGLIHVENQEQSDFTLVEGQLEITGVSSRGGGPAGPSPVSLDAGQTMRAKRDQPFQVTKAVRLPSRPAVNVSQEQLPTPRANWRELVSKDQRPPAVSQVTAVSSRAAATGKAPTLAKPAQATKPAKNSRQRKPPALR